MKIESGSESGEFRQIRGLGSPIEHQGIDFGDKVPHRAPRSLPFDLKTNPTVDHIADRLRQTPPDWDAIFTHIEEMPNAPDAHQDLVGLIGEIHVNQVVNEIAGSEEFVEVVDLNPIDSGTEAGDYLFYRDAKNNMRVRSLSRGEGVAEYDFFAEAEGLPLVGEVRITENRHGSRQKGKGYTNLLDPETIKRKLTPIQTLYEAGEAEREQLGYMVVSTKDVVLSEYWSGDYTGSKQPPHDTPEKRFLKQGGILVTLPFKLQDVSTEVIDYRRVGKGVRRNKAETKGTELQRQLLEKYGNLAPSWPLKQK